MAKPAILRGTYVNILIGDGAIPTEVFTPLCGATTRGLANVVETNDDYTRDCALPGSVPTRNVVPTGQHWDMSFSGVLNRTQLSVMQAAIGVKKNYRFELAEPAGDVVYGGYWAGAALMNNFTITGDDGANTTIEGSILSDGTWAFTVVP